MASQNCESEPDSLPVNGAEQRQADLFQNIEKLIASAVSICRLDGSVQCQIGGLITVIEELQRLLRQSYAEIKRLEKSLDDQKHTSKSLEENVDEFKKTFRKMEGNLEDQKHMFTNNITNLHYQVKEVQSNVETLKHQMEEVEKFRETKSLQNNLSETADEQIQTSLVDESHEDCSYGEEVDSDSIPNVFEGMSKYNEETKEKDDSIDVNSATAHVPNDQLPLVNLDRDVAMDETRPSPDLDEDIPVDETRPSSHLNIDIPVDETRPSSNLNIDIPVDETRPPPNQDRDIAMDDTNAGSDLVPSPDKDIDMPEKSQNITSKQDLPPNGTPHINPSNSLPNETATSSKEERNSVLRVLRSHSDTTLAKSASSTEEKSNKRNHQGKSTKRLETNTVVNRTSLSPRKTRHVINSPEKSTSPAKRGRPRKAVVENQVSIRNAAKRTSPIKQAQSPQRKITPKRTVSSREVKKPTDSQTKQEKELLGRSSPVSAKITRKSTGSNLVKNTRNSITKNKQSSVSPNTKAHKIVSSRKSKGGTANDNQSLAKKASPLSEKNPMDKYINLDFLLNANQHMSELVTDSSREEGTLDTASEAERRRVVALAKLYGLRVRMAGKEGELPVALIKGRESSLPQPGQVDKLLYSMTRAMVIKRQAAESRDWTKKHKLSGSRRNVGSPAKKKRV